MTEVLLCTHCPSRRFALQSYYLGVSLNHLAGMPFHLVAEYLATVPHLSYTQVNTVGQPTARTELVHKQVKGLGFQAFFLIHYHLEEVLC